MLRLDLRRLERDGTVDLEEEVAVDDPLWSDSDLAFEEPVQVVVRAHEAGTGEVVVRGRIWTTLRRECRRCSIDLSIPFDRDVTLVFAPRDEASSEGDSDTHELPAGVDMIELGPPIREEMVLSLAPYEDCPEQTEGLCDRGREHLEYDGKRDEDSPPDPRWAALRELQDERSDDDGPAEDAEPEHD